MNNLAKDGEYSIEDKQRKMLSDFASGYATEEDCAAAIKALYKEDGYVIDPHTAVAASVYKKYRSETGDNTPTVIVSTASPYKFARSVLGAIDKDKYDSHTDMEQFDDLETVSGVSAPQAITELKSASVRHTKVVDKDEMISAVKENLSI